MRLIATFTIAACASLLATLLAATAAKKAKDIDRLIDALCGGVLEDCEAALLPNLLELLSAIEVDTSDLQDQIDELAVNDETRREQIDTLNERVAALQEGQLFVFDGDGNELGPSFDVNSDGNIRFFSRELGAIIAVTDEGRVSIKTPIVYFDLPGCQGQAYLNAPHLNVLLKVGPDESLRFFVPIDTPLVTVEAKSLTGRNSLCENIVATFEEGHSLNEVTGAIPFPLFLPVPIRVGPAAP